MPEELDNKIAKYRKAAASASSEVERSQYLQVVAALEAQRPKPKLHVAQESVCTSCE